MAKTKAYAAHDKTGKMVPFEVSRRELKPSDIQIDILYCGICHTDLHYIKNEWKNTKYPVVPGHEIVGRITAIGKEVKGFKVGDLAAVGCMVDSCGTCPSCKENLEQYCHIGSTFTYNSQDRKNNEWTYGGYSKKIVVDEKFVLPIPKEFSEKDLAGVAPLLCAGITTFSPLNHWKVKKGSKVGVVGLGGLGHMAIKLAHAMGAEVILFTTSPGKAADAKKLGAQDVVLSKDENQMKKYLNQLDFLLDTVAFSHDLTPYIATLKRDGVMCLVGAPEHAHPPLDPTQFIFFRRSLAGSLIGGIKETKEMLEFCAKHGITADIEVIRMDQINEALERLSKNDVKYRFVIDMASL